MDEPQQPRRARRPNSEYRWTEVRAIAFLRCLAETGSVTAAAARAGLSRNSAYRLRARMSPEFAAIWTECVRQGIGRRHLERHGNAAAASADRPLDAR